MLTIEERVYIVSARIILYRGATGVHSEISQTRTNIRLLLNKFQRTGNVVDETRSGRPSVPEVTVQRSN